MAGGRADHRHQHHALHVGRRAPVCPLHPSQVARHASIDTTTIYVHEEDRLDNPGEQYIDYQNGNDGEA